MSAPLVIFLHGVGSRGADLAPLAQLWQPLLPGARFVAPDAPFAFEAAPEARQWFSIAGVTDANRPDRVAAARPAFDALIGGLIAEHGLSDGLDRVALVGFSQGSIMALDACASGRWPVAGVVAFAGRLASPQPLSPSPDTRVLLVHGGGDPVIPAIESRRAQQTLSAAGVAVERHELPGLGHQLSIEGATLAGRFLATLFAAPAQASASAR